MVKQIGDKILLKENTGQYGLWVLIGF
jgi:hypothetical protein